MTMPASPAPNDTLAQLAEILGEQDARDLVRTYLEEYDGLFRTLVRGDREKQHRAAHALKSSSRHMGLTALAQRFAALETRLAQPDGTVETKDITAIMADFERLTPPLKKYVKAT